MVAEVWTCEIFLCLFHVFRYWKENILCSAKKMGYDGNEVMCSGDEKSELFNKIYTTYKSPTHDIYEVIVIFLSVTNVYLYL